MMKRGGVEEAEGTVPLPPKAGQVYGEYSHVSEGKQLGN